MNVLSRVLRTKTEENHKKYKLLLSADRPNSKLVSRYIRVLVVYNLKDKNNNVRKTSTRTKPRQLCYLTRSLCKTNADVSSGPQIVDA
jgi:hypothetical protein